MNKNINKPTYILLCTITVAMIIAAVMQLFLPWFLGSTAEYGLNAGWQREIGIWNLAMIGILIGTLWKGTRNTVYIILTGGIIMGIGFGTNHLLGFVKDTSKFMSLFGAVENFIFVFLLIWFNRPGYEPG